jgi:hypothetical protein
MSGIYEHLVPETLDPVPVHVYEHPDWEMKLILLAEPNSREQALQNLADDATDADRSLLTCEARQMSRDEFVNLQEFDG